MAALAADELDFFGGKPEGDDSGVFPGIEVVVLTCELGGLQCFDVAAVPVVFVDHGFGWAVGSKDIVVLGVVSEFVLLDDFFES